MGVSILLAFFENLTYLSKKGKKLTCIPYVTISPFFFKNVNFSCYNILSARMAELADAADLKSVGYLNREGSSPSLSINKNSAISMVAKW